MFVRCDAVLCCAMLCDAVRCQVVQLLQSIFDRFDTLADTFSVQKVRKTVNESYMVAAGLPDPELLRTPEQRASGIAALAFAMVHVMAVVNATQADDAAAVAGSATEPLEYLDIA